MKVRIKKKLFLLISVLAALVFLLAIFWWLWATGPVVCLSCPNESQTVFVIKKGESLSSIAKRLDEKGIIRSALAFKIKARNLNLSTKIQAGSFRLSNSLPLVQVVQTMSHGTLDVWVTFLEGWRREEFARQLTESLDDFDQTEFLRATQELEGQLFPDTYLIPKQAESETVIGLLTKNFNQKFNEELITQTHEQDLNPQEVLILASIVEREVKTDKDRAMVAGILIKRWKDDWPLQADATVQYALAGDIAAKIEIMDWTDFDWWPDISKKDLSLDSAYNTYLHQGLPPGPICNPGLASIKAVIYSQPSEYWFYLSDFDGQIHYARDNQEQNENIRKHLVK